jgi:putative Ca2+/H+ antiporter (TMEM165/GDT1 family)
MAGVMRKENIDLIGGLIFTLMGLWFLTGYKKLGQKTSDFYFHLLSVRFSAKGYQSGFFIAGICFTIFGLLLLFGIIHTR